MKTDVILSKKDFDDLEETRKRLLSLNPDIVYLDLTQPTDMFMVERFSKLENDTWEVVPIITLLGSGALILSDMIKQFNAFFRDTQIAFRISGEIKTEAFETYLKMFFNSLDIPFVIPFPVFLPAVDMIKTNSIYSVLFNFIKQLELSFEPIPQISNMEGSLLLFDNREFKEYLRVWPRDKIFCIHLIGNWTNDDVDHILDLFANHDIEAVWSNLGSVSKYFSYLEQLPVVMTARIIVNKASTWSEPHGKGYVKRKLGLQEQVTIQELDGDYALLVEGDYIPLAHIDIEQHY